MIPNSKSKIRLSPKALFPVLAALLLFFHPLKSTAQFPVSSGAKGLPGGYLTDAYASYNADIVVVGKLEKLGPGYFNSDFVVKSGLQFYRSAKISNESVLKGKLDARQELQVIIKWENGEVLPVDGRHYIFFISVKMKNSREWVVLKMLRVGRKSIEETAALIKNAPKTTPPAH